MSAGGQARRRERTRSALIRAAQRFLAEGRTAVSIQEVTDAAGVGFGSFYNHFADKEALFEAALEATLISYGELLDALVAGIDDPAEVFAASFRLTGRLCERSPEFGKLLLHSGTAVLVNDQGLRPRALHDLQAAKETGRFEFDDPEVAFMAAGSAMLGMLQLLSAEPHRDVAASTDAFVALTLRMLGLTAEEAGELVSRPLPDVPSLRQLVT